MLYDLRIAYTAGHETCWFRDVNCDISVVGIFRKYTTDAALDVGQFRDERDRIFGILPLVGICEFFEIRHSHSVFGSFRIDCAVIVESLIVLEDFSNLSELDVVITGVGCAKQILLSVFEPQ